MPYFWVDIDIWKTAVRELHRLANGLRAQAWVKVLTRVVRDLKAEQDVLRAELLLQTSYTSQVASVEKCLNDAYDAVSRRITLVSHGQYTDLVYLRESTESVPLTYLRERLEAKPVTYLRDEGEQPGELDGDFSVYCPNDVSPLPTPQQLGRLVNRYRPAGKRWNLVYTSPTTGLPVQTLMMIEDPTTI